MKIDPFPPQTDSGTLDPARTVALRPPTATELTLLRSASIGLAKVMEALEKPPTLAQQLEAELRRQRDLNLPAEWRNAFAAGWKDALRRAGVPFLLALALLLPASAHASSRPRGYHPRPLPPIHTIHIPARPRPRPHGPRRPR